MQNIGSWVLHREMETVEAKVRSRFRGNSVAMIRRLATLDMGIAALPERVMMEELASGQLLRILPEWTLAPISAYAVTETRLLPAKTQRFIEFLRERLREA